MVFVFLGCFWAYVSQPHCHIGWARSMPFASFNPTNTRTNLWNFHKNILRIGDLEKLSFFWVSHFGIFFASSPWKSVNIYRLARMGRNFDDYPGFQPKTTFLYYFAHDCSKYIYKLISIFEIGFHLENLHSGCQWQLKVKNYGCITLHFGVFLPAINSSVYLIMYVLCYGTIHILCKHIFRLFGPPSPYVQSVF